MKQILLSLTLLYIIPNQVFAWDGYDYDKGTYVEIEKGDVREGNEIEIYNYDDGSYKDVEVTSFDGSEVEYTDPDTGETRTIDMD